MQINREKSGFACVCAKIVVILQRKIDESMRRLFGLVIFGWMIGGLWSVVNGQSSAVKLPQVRVLETKGWSVQHSVMAWDSLSVYFSAQAPGTNNYDLYVMRADGWRWSEPEKLASICTDEDEWWPSISSDEKMLFYVHRTPANPNEKNSREKQQIWRAWQREKEWSEAAPLIISGDNDSEPRILEDNCTLLFVRRTEGKRHEVTTTSMYATMMDDHNWTLPMAYTEMPQAQPILAVSGEVVMVKGRRPLTTGRVMVYDAMTEQLQQEAQVHTVSGHWRVALRKNKHYRLAITAPGYSYRYIDIRTDSLAARAERTEGTIVLDNQLALRLNGYDAENQQTVYTTRQVLPLGQLHSVRIQQKGYEDTTLVINTKRPTVFTETELDIPLQPLKSPHLFIVSDARTEDLIEDATLRLNGQPTSTYTALRINQEVAVQVSAPGYLFYDTLINTGATPQQATIRIRLLPIEKGMVLQLRNIQFEYDSYELTESSNDALEALAQLMQINPTLRIELSAHTDDQGSDRYNDKLSTLRGQAVASWLKQHGIDGERIESVGYGKRKPLVENDSEENRAINRRVEIKVLEF